MHKHPDYPVKTKYDGLAHYLYRTNKPSKIRLQGGKKIMNPPTPDQSTPFKAF